MVVRDIMKNVNEVEIIARAIFEDHFEIEEFNKWITKYYAQLTQIRNSKVIYSDLMIYFSVVTDDLDGRIYGDVSGFDYKDIKASKTIYYGVEDLDVEKYASIYVPMYSIQSYGVNVVASEILREYGWNIYDESIVCPDDVRNSILKALIGIKSELKLTDDRTISTDVGNSLWKHRKAGLFRIGKLTANLQKYYYD